VAAGVLSASPMPSKDVLLFRIGTLALAFCAILSAQIVTTPKFPNPPMRHGPTCPNCVRDLDGNISSNPAPVRKFRSTHACPANGSLQGPCPGYVVDYKKALNKGGKDTLQNMRWRTIAQATKGRVK
jgi:hypothetical protein